MRHLELYEEPWLYDVLRPKPERFDGPFYLDLAHRTGPRVLELACGNGILTAFLAADDSLDVTGLDLSEQMLARAKENVPGARFLQGDMRDFALGETFDLVVLPLNSLLLLTETKDIIAALRRAREHLGENGRFAFDIFHPDLTYLSRDPKQTFGVASRTDPKTGKTVHVTETTRYERATQMKFTQWFYAWEDSDETISHDVVVRVIFPEEMLALLEMAGLCVVDRFGDFRRWPFDDASEHQVIVARAR